MKRSLTSQAARKATARLGRVNRLFGQRHPGETGRRQPVHTVYGGAHLFRADLAKRLGAAARRMLEEYAPNAAAFAKAVGLPERLADTIYARVVAKLDREPV